MTLTLSQQQAHDFARDGFLIARTAFSADEMAAAAHAIEALSNRRPEAGRQMVYFEDSLIEPGARVLSRIERFVEFEPALARLVFDARIVWPLTDLLGDRPVLFKDKINFKMPGGGGFTPHQDIQPGWDQYASYFISVLVAVDPNTIENGALEFAAGHHRRGLIGRRWEPLEGQELVGLEFVAYPMDPGDVAFFDCFTPHRSKPNLTGRPRRNLYLTFNRASEGDSRNRYFTEKRKNFPPDFERAPGATYVFRV
jgi:ectoine hydroxylase-related dioxygenase (phytanoyl-CoA dioxygenase family)